MSFYVFVSPAYDLVVGYLMFLTLVSSAVSLSIYGFLFGVEEFEPPECSA